MTRLIRFQQVSRAESPGKLTLESMRKDDFPKKQGKRMKESRAE